MNNIKIFFHSLILFSLLLTPIAYAVSNDSQPFHATIQSIPLVVQQKMKKYTWHPGCPIALKQLAYIRLSYWGFDHKTHTGVLVVNKKLAKEVVHIFNQLYLHHFPIQSMKPMEEFAGNDLASMKANNTSSFNCRDLTNKPGVFSQHSYGRAIDINPLINPFIKEQTVSPPGGKQFLNRKRPYPGKIIKNDLVFQLFTQSGWDWGALWYDLQDYQHFEKRANGAKRNPYGN